MTMVFTLAVRGATLIGVLLVVLVLLVVALGATGFSDRMLTAIVSEDMRGLRQDLAQSIRDPDRLEETLDLRRQDLETFYGLDRSWYNRAGVEVVMGFSTPEEQSDFIRDVPAFEAMLTEANIVPIKIWLDITKGEQARRLEARVEDPLKHFKTSPLDAEAQKRWHAYTEARDTMLLRSHSPHAPWLIVATDDKKQARLNVMRHLVERLGVHGLSVTTRSVDPAIAFPFEPEALNDGRMAR